MTIEYICEWGKGDPEIKEELIRCKDCMWHVRDRLTTTGEEDRRYNPTYCEIMRFQTPDDGYCYVARREE